MAALGLCCCTRAFSSCGERGLHFRCSARASHCSSFSRCRVLALGMRASVVVARGLSSCGSVVVAHGLSCSAACGIFRTRARTRVPCIDRQILNRWATREGPHFYFLIFQFQALSFDFPPWRQGFSSLTITPLHPQTHTHTDSHTLTLWVNPHPSFQYGCDSLILKSF